MDNEKALEIAIAAAMQAGRYLMDHYKEPLASEMKESVRDLATPMDRGAESVALSVIRAQGEAAAIVCEEGGAQGDAQAAGCWVVDALDGTVNYLHQIPFFAVSIAYQWQGRTQVGVVYAPLSDDIYYAADGVGAFKNQRRIQTPDRAPHESLFSASFSGKNHEPQRRAQEFELFARVNDASRGCLRTGSASLNLAYLAEGRINGCWGKYNKLWDLCAGLLIAQVAGAKVWSAQSPSAPDLVSYVAAPQQNHDWLLSLAQPVLMSRRSA